jgi:hypothetical protein
MERQTLFEYEALGASASLTHDRQWLLNFRTSGGSVLIRMDRIVFEDLMKGVEQESDQGPPPPSPS